MSHSGECLWKRQVISDKLKREVTLDEVHILCDFLGFSDPADTVAWIENASAEEIERVLEEAKKRRRRRRLLSEGYEYSYATA
jgi:hypothetical protein